MHLNVSSAILSRPQSFHLIEFHAYREVGTTDIRFMVLFQIHNQFPLSFEFNQFFLKFLAYHYVSNRFRTFMMDNEYERVEAGWLLHERRKSEGNGEVDEMGNISPRHGMSQGMNVWDYVRKNHQSNSVFHNFMYSVMDQETVSDGDRLKTLTASS